MFLFDQLKNIATHGKSHKKRIAQLLLDHRFTIHRYSLQDFVLLSQCSRSTIERFCKYLGYQRFNELKKAIFDGLRSTAKTHEWLENTQDILDEYLPKFILEQEIACLRNIEAITTLPRYHQLLSSLHQADKIFILGSQASSPMVRAYAYELGKIHKNIILIDHLNEITTQVISSATKNDVALVFGFPRFPNIMIQFTELLAKRNSKIILFSHTLGNDSPFQQYADITIRIYLHYYGFTTGFSPLTALLSLIILQYCRLYPHDSQESIQNFESALRVCNNFYSSER